MLLAVVEAIVAVAKSEKSFIFIICLLLSCLVFQVFEFDDFEDKLLQFYTTSIQLSTAVPDAENASILRSPPRISIFDEQICLLNSC